MRADLVNDLGAQILNPRIAILSQIFRFFICPHLFNEINTICVVPRPGRIRPGQKVEQAPVDNGISASGRLFLVLLELTSEVCGKSL